MFTFLGSYITFPTSFGADILTYGGTLISDLSPYLTIILGVLVVVLVVVALVGAFHK